MKKTYIATSMIALTILAAAGITTAVYAADDTGALPVIGRLFGRHGDKPAQALTDAQKADIQVKMEAVKAALETGDYDAWVTAVKAIDEDSPLLTRVTADNFSEYAAKEAERETQMAARKADQVAVTAALNANDYEAWAKAMKALDENFQALQKITSENFGQYVQAYNLRVQADSILKELGVNGFEMKGFGGRGYGGMGSHGGLDGMGSFGGRGMGMPADQNASDSSETN